jgi:hypothetical protein
MARVGERRGAHRVLVRKTVGKRSLERSRSRREDSIITGLLNVGLAGMDWIDLAQYKDRWRKLVNAVTNLRVQQKAGNFLTS